MGNKIARTTQASATEYYLHDLPSSYNLVLKEVLGRGRFFKSIQCKHDEGLVLVKVYFKRGDQIDLREYEKRLFHIRDTFRKIENPHVWPFQVSIFSFSLDLIWWFVSILMQLNWVVVSFWEFGAFLSFLNLRTFYFVGSIGFSGIFFFGVTSVLIPPLIRGHCLF